MKKIALMLLLIAVAVELSSSQTPVEKIDSAAVEKIKDEGMNRSQVMDILSNLSDVYGPRLTGSPGLVHAEEWAKSKMESWNLANVHFEKWGEFGRGWSLKHYSANVVGRQVFPLISYPKAWSPSTNGTVTGDIVWCDAKTDSALAPWKGKLKGKFVMFSDQREIKAHFDPEGTRLADSSLLQMANADMPGSGQMRRMFTPTAEQKARALVDYHKLLMCIEEGAAGILTISGGDGGNVFVQQASVPNHPDTSFANRVSAWQKKAPKIVPQFAVGAEHYDRLARMILKGEHPKLEVNLEVAFNEADSVSNVIAEIPGTDLKDEVVMIGAHFDSWHGGTGATDNGTGSSVCLEAMRILKTLDLKPRRTIRIGLWSGEEQGLLGSHGYVTAHFGERSGGGGGGGQRGGGGQITYKAEAEKFSAYFNNDNGSGKVRGVYMEANEAARPIFRAWLAPFKSLGASTLTLSRTGGTDHQSFDGINLPGFQFIQDEIEYGTRTHHSTMDVWDRAQPEDLKQAAAIMAAFAYDAASRDEKFPRKPMPAPAGTQGSR